MQPTRGDALHGSREEVRCCVVVRHRTVYLSVRQLLQLQLLDASERLNLDEVYVLNSEIATDKVEIGPSQFIRRFVQ